ncbi:hypothetical protein RYX36_035743 [Vicia faba]
MVELGFEIGMVEGEINTDICKKYCELNLEDKYLVEDLCKKVKLDECLLKPNPAKEDITEVVHEELQPYQLDDVEEIERLKGLVVNFDETPGDFIKDGDLGSNYDPLFDLDFDSLRKSNKARIVEPKF